MKGIVEVVNSRRGMYAAKIEDENAYVIFELLDSDAPEIGDVISHPDFYSMGSETYNNLTQQCEIDVYVQNVCGPSLVRKQCLL